MKPSWKFFAAFAAAFFLVFGLTVAAFCLNLGVRSNSSQWAFDINQKKRLLAAQPGSPKLLVVGGSATLFGVSAREIQNQTGFRTINLGTHASLGTSYILYLAQEAAKPGDTVLLVPEYELYTYGKIERASVDSLLLDYIVARDPAFFHSLSPMEKWNVFMFTPNDRLIHGLKNRFRAPRPLRGKSIYDLRYINEWGDQTHHTEAARPPLRDSLPQMKCALGYGLPPEPKGFAKIEAFCRWARANGIRVLATFPNLSDDSDYHSSAARQEVKTITDFFAGLQVPVIGDYTDALLPADQFFDTIYHPTEEAALARTRRLVEQLKPHLKLPAQRH
jgi:hypothetical protein